MIAAVYARKSTEQNGVADADAKWFGAGYESVERRFAG
jgi:hypothetical protein